MNDTTIHISVGSSVIRATTSFTQTPVAEHHTGLAFLVVMTPFNHERFRDAVPSNTLQEFVSHRDFLLYDMCDNINDLQYFGLLDLVVNF